MDHLRFLQMCNQTLYEYFEQLYDDKLVYCTLAYKSNIKKTFEIVPGKDDLTGYNFGKMVNDSFRQSLKMLLDESQDINSQIIINLTNILLNKSYGCDLFFVEDEDDYISIGVNNSQESNIKTFPLGKIKYDEDIEKFMIINEGLINTFIELIRVEDFPDNKQYARYLWHYKKIGLEMPGNFYVHFIRPSFIDFNYNILLALATTQQLTETEIAIIDLIVYRIIGQTAVEKSKEFQEIQSKRALSVESHALQTQLQTTIIPLKNDFKDKLVYHKKKINNAFEEMNRVVSIAIDESTSNKEELMYLDSITKIYIDKICDAKRYFNEEVDDRIAEYDEHDLEIEGLFELTLLRSIVDKIEHKDKLMISAKSKKLFSDSLVYYDIRKHIEKYNNRNKNNVILIKSFSELNEFYIPIYDIYLGERLVKLFFDMLCENIEKFGIKINKTICMEVNQELKNNTWMFINKMIDKEVDLDEKKLKGNLKLFKTLIEDTASGEMEIMAKDYIFSIRLSFK
jgi:hypothetical protein